MNSFYDFETEQEDIQRRQAIANAMQSGALAPLQAQSVPGAKISPMEGIAQLVKAYMAGKQQLALKDERAALRGKMGESLQAGMETLSSAADPQAKKQAIFQAIASGHPVLKELGMRQLASMDKGSLTPDKLADLSTPESVMQSPNDPSKWKPKRSLKGVGSGEVLLDEGGNVAQPGAGASMPGQLAVGGTPSGNGWQTVKIDGDLYQMTATGLKKLDNSPKISTHVTNSPVIQGQKAGVEAWSKEAAKTVSEMADSAKQSVALLTKLDQLGALTADGTYSGPLANPAMFVTALANQAGIKVDPRKLQNSEAFNSTATQAWAALMQQNGGARGLVKEESEKLAQSLPSLLQTPQGRAQIIQILSQTAKQNIADAKQASMEFSDALNSGDLRKFTFGLSRTQLPQSGALSPVPGVGGKRVFSWNDPLPGEQ